MARTYVHVELVKRSASIASRFWAAMRDRGFRRTVRGQPSRRTLRLPEGMFVIDRATAAEALKLARGAVDDARAKARIFCIPGGGDVRFGNLSFDDPSPPA
jgi:hypothetical protein